jgi:hypothetical protein
VRRATWTAERKPAKKEKLKDHKTKHRQIN